MYNWKSTSTLTLNSIGPVTSDLVSEMTSHPSRIFGHVLRDRDRILSNSTAMREVGVGAGAGASAGVGEGLVSLVLILNLIALLTLLSFRDLGHHCFCFVYSVLLLLLCPFSADPERTESKEHEFR